MQDKMTNECDYISNLNSRLEKVIKNGYVTLGLFRGKTGWCIYFYCMHRLTGNTQYKKTAEELLDAIWNGISSITSINVEDGLSGIGLGLTYLAKHSYINADLNYILDDVDSLIMKKLFYEKQDFQKYETTSLIYLLYYFKHRYLEQKEKSYKQEIYRELIILLLNKTYERIIFTSNRAAGSSIYKFSFELPMFLYLLKALRELGFYNYKIDRILKEVKPIVCSIYPILQSNRLFLLWGIDSVIPFCEQQEYHSHVKLLKDGINIKDILERELKDKQIYFNNGASSIYLLYKMTSKYWGADINSSIFRDKITKSEAWKMLRDNNLYFDNHLGLFDGYCGSVLTLYNLK